MARIPRYRSLPSPQQRRNMSVGVKDAQGNVVQEAVSWALYDQVTYLAAGQSQLAFFNTPVGGGSPSKTFGQTNLELQSQLPVGKQFMCESLELIFVPGTAVLPSSGPAADTTSKMVNDVYTFYYGVAWAELKVQSKFYVQEGPLLQFPPKRRLGGFAALASSTTAGPALQTMISAAWPVGPTYRFDPPFEIPSAQNFSLTLNWPAALAISANATVFARMEGILYRPAQ